MNGAVVHWQMITKDPEVTAKFYESTFGWRFSANNGLGYREVASNANNGFDGGIWPAPPDAPETVQLYIEVENIESTLDRIEALGGKVIMQKQILPDGDAMALAVDPLGRTFGLMTSGRNRAAEAFEPPKVSTLISRIAQPTESKVVSGTNRTVDVDNGDYCVVIAGTHSGKTGIVQDRKASKTGHITITVSQSDGIRFKTLAKNVKRAPTPPALK